MQIEQLLARRTDLSTFLVHLTRDADGQSAKDRLISIVTSGTLEARTGFGPAVSRLIEAGQPVDSQKCVCFTETPLEHVHILTSPIDDRDFHFQSYGIAISKKQGRRRGVNPVWYQDITPGHNWLSKPLERMIDIAIAAGDYSKSDVANLTPFIEQMGRGANAAGTGGYKKEFWWEREWRHQGNYPLMGRPIILCPAADMKDVRDALNAIDKFDRWVDDPSYIDPRWSLEQIIGKLAGFTMDDLGAF